MEEADVSSGSGGPSLTALLLKSSVFASVVFLIALGLRDLASAAGAALGVVGAAIYSWGYLGSHLERLDRSSERDAGERLFGQASLRLLVLAGVTGGMWFAGRATFLGFLIGFAIGFAVIVVSEAPRIRRTLRTRGSVG